MAFLGFLGKRVPAIGNLGYSLGLSEKPVETAAGVAPNPIGSVLSGGILPANVATPSSPPFSNIYAPVPKITERPGSPLMNLADQSAKWLNYGLSMQQPAQPISTQPVAVETVDSGVIPAGFSSVLGLGRQIAAPMFTKQGWTGALGGALAVEGVSQLANMGGGIPDGTMTAIGKFNVSSKGNLIITRAMKRKLKSLADTVGLAQAAEIVGIDIGLASAILLKTFPTREKGVTGRELRQCRRVVNKMKHFYNMIPTRTTGGRRTTTVSRGVTQIKN